MSRGVDFPTLWNTILKPHPYVAGIPVQRLNGTRPYVEVPLRRGDWLVIDYEAKSARLP